MKATFHTAQFQTNVGTFNIWKDISGSWNYECINGYSNGLHNNVPFGTFDKCYIAVKKVVKTETTNLKLEL